MALSIKEGPVKCAMVCDKSWVILMYIYDVKMLNTGPVSKIVSGHRECLLYISKVEGAPRFSKRSLTTLSSPERWAGERNKIEGTLILRLAMVKRL